MPSPFPGMDPYIEASGLWRSFHARLLSRILDRLEESLPPKYRARTEEREVIELVEAEGKDDAPFYPDVGVTGPAKRPPEGGVAVAEPPTEGQPLSLRPFVADEFRERFIEITVTEPERRLVTCIEVLSPSNKRPRSDSRRQYLRKRQALLLGEASLLEIDLLRGGERMPMLDPLPASPFYLLVGRYYRRERCQVWPAYFRQPLPPIPVPLDPPDPDVIIDLQSMIASVYERSRLGEDIDYRNPLEPALAEADLAWLQEQLKARQPTT